MIGAEGAGRSGLAGAPGFTLGGLEVRPATREVVSGAAADVLEPRVMQVLVALAERRGQVVSRSDLIDACWDGRAVGDDAINRCIQALRRLSETRGGFAILTVARVGYRLDEHPRSPADAPATASPPPSTAGGGYDELRHVTVLSCGPVRAAGNVLDPQDWVSTTRAWRRAAADTALRFGAHVEGARGDRLVAYFGYPAAQEDAAQRAVRAGLAIAESAPGGLTVQVGVHAGVVVMARGVDGHPEMFGEAPDVAARVQDGAPSGAVIITGAVHDVVSDVVATESLGALQQAATGGPVRLYRALSAGPASRGFAPREPSPFVGRDDEARLLKGRWARVEEGEGQLVLAAGEPGIGKTRLVQEFRARLQDGAHRVIECAGAPLFASTPFHAVTQILQQGLDWREADTPADRFARLEAALARAELDPAGTAPLIADLLGLPAPYAPLDMAPDQRRKRLLAALAAWVFALAAPRPLLLVVEDLHWVDPSSLELLQTLAEQGATSRVMLLCTARPEFQAPWPERSHHSRINLPGLAARPMRALVDGLVSRAGMAEEMVDAVVRRADGVPLFAEELTRLMLDGEGNRAPRRTEAGDIPATLLDSLAARLDRLGAGKSVAQLGSVLGRQFTHSVLQAVSPLPEADLRAGLAQLAGAELIYVRGTAPEATYQFKHALIQDAAHAGLLRADRRALHAAVALTLTTRFADLAEARPEVLARHWTEAGEVEKAIAAWTRAAEAAEARHAFVEAEEDYRRALALLETTPETPARDQHELDLGLALIKVTAATQGYQSSETAAVSARNHVLAERGGFLGANTGMRMMAFSLHLIAGDWPKVEVYARQARAFAESLGPGTEPKWFRFAHAMAPFTEFTHAYYSGDLQTAEARYGQWEALQAEGEYDQRLSSTPGFSNGAQLAWRLGRPDVAQRRMARARAWAAQTGDPYEVMFADALDALLQVSLRDADRAEAVAAEAVRVCEEKGFPQVAGWARAALGWARAQRGAPREGAAMIRRAIADLEALQTRITMPFFLALLAEGQALDGDVEAAVTSFEMALAADPDQRIYRPYVLLCRGEFNASLQRSSEAEADFRAAIAEADDMGAAADALRAASGLARLMRPRADKGAARPLLAARLEAVTPSETRDVQEAKALLREL